MNPSRQIRGPHWRVFMIVLVVVFAAEAAVMIVLPLVVSSEEHPGIQAFADAALLTVILAPVLWWLFSRPLRRMASGFTQSWSSKNELRSSAVANHCDDFIGQMLGEYEVLEWIGAGGTGEVFKAQHSRMKRTVAIKLLSSAVSKDAEAIHRFQREMEATARLQHPNIVTAHDAGEALGGRHFLVMEFIEGRDLAALVKYHGRLSPSCAVECILQTARGLSYANSQGVVHRDIKPANLMVDKMGTVKILDLGLVRLDEPAKHALTQTGQVMGTVDFMAPEQAFDTRLADARSDIYSLGCTLYFLLTGANLYQGENIVQKLLAHQQQLIPSLSDSQGGIGGSLDAIFQKMVAKRPEERFQSMADVSAALESWQLTHAAADADTESAQQALANLVRTTVECPASSQSIDPANTRNADSATILSGPPNDVGGKHPRGEEPTPAAPQVDAAFKTTNAWQR